jgi:hypothetical protein
MVLEGRTMPGSRSCDSLSSKACDGQDTEILAARGGFLGVFQASVRDGAGVSEAIEFLLHDILRSGVRPRKSSWAEEAELDAAPVAVFPCSPDADGPELRSRMSSSSSFGCIPCCNSTSSLWGRSDSEDDHCEEEEEEEE